MTENRENIGESFIFHHQFLPVIFLGEALVDIKYVYITQRAYTCSRKEKKTKERRRQVITITVKIT